MQEGDDEHEKFTNKGSQAEQPKSSLNTPMSLHDKVKDVRRDHKKKSKQTIDEILTDQLRLDTFMKHDPSKEMNAPHKPCKIVHSPPTPAEILPERTKKPRNYDSEYSHDLSRILFCVETTQCIY